MTTAWSTIFCRFLKISIVASCSVGKEIQYCVISSCGTFKYTKFKYVNMQEPLSIKPTEEMEKKLEILTKIEKIEKSTLVRKILDRAIDEELKQCALELFENKKVSLAKAAEIAGVPIREMIDLIKERGISLHITVQDIREDFEAVLFSGILLFLI